MSEQSYFNSKRLQIPDHQNLIVQLSICEICSQIRLLSQECISNQTEKECPQHMNTQKPDQYFDYSPQSIENFETYLQDLSSEIPKLIQQLKNAYFVSPSLENPISQSESNMISIQQNSKNLKFEQVKDIMNIISKNYILDIQKLIAISKQHIEMEKCKQNIINDFESNNYKTEQQIQNSILEELNFISQEFRGDTFDKNTCINQFIKQAQILSERGLYKDSLKCYDKALAIDDKNLICWRGKGDCLQQLQEFSDAIQQYDQALQIEKNDIQSLIGKGDCLRKLQQYQDSKGIYEYVLTFDDKNVASRFGLGECLRDQGAFKQAIEQYEIVLKFDQKNVSYLYGKGYCLRSIQEYKQAIKFFDQVLKIEPKNEQALREHDLCIRELSKTQQSKLLSQQYNINEDGQNIFYTEDQQNRGTKKIYHLSDIRQINLQKQQQENGYLEQNKSYAVFPNNAQPSKLIRSESFDNKYLIQIIDEADALKKSGNYLKALSLFEKVLEKDPYNMISLNGKGFCLRMMFRFQESIEILNKAISINNNKDSLYGKGECLRMLKQLDEAEKCYQESLAKCQSDTDDKMNKCMNLRGLGDILRQRSEFTESIKMYDQALSLNENHILSLFGKAESLRGQAKFDESLIFYEKSLKLNQNHILSLSGMGESLRMLKHYQKAQEFHEKVLSMQENRIVNLRGLSECLRHQNQADKALKLIEKALLIAPGDEKCLNSKQACLRDIKRKQEALSQNQNQKNKK